MKDLKFTKQKRAAVIKAGHAINPLDVFEYYGWRCQYCGLYMSYELVGTNDPEAPTIDHIVPLSKGGTHTDDNITCACRRCNSKKCNKQLLKPRKV